MSDSRKIDERTEQLAGAMLRRGLSRPGVGEARSADNPPPQCNGPALPTPVMQLLMVLSETTDILASSISVLQDRLGPVLLPREQSDKLPDANASNVCPLVDELNGFVIRVKTAAAWVNEITNRLAI